jgi:tellurite resistance protein TerC
MTEKALSVDNLFVFLITTASFKVPRPDQQKALLLGIGFSLVVRTAFIFLGAALVNSYAFVFYIFGLLLLVTAGQLLKAGTANGHSANNIIVRLAKQFRRTSETYDRDRLFTIVRSPPRDDSDAARHGGPRWESDVLFALDSIPVIFGLTQSVSSSSPPPRSPCWGCGSCTSSSTGYWTVSSTCRTGSPRSWGFVGIRLILHALYENKLPFVNGAEPSAQACR